MIFFCIPELRYRHHFRRDGPVLVPFSVDSHCDLLCDDLLLGRVREDRAPILRPDIRALCVELRWVVDAIEELQELSVCHDRRVEYYLH